MNKTKFNQILCYAEPEHTGITAQSDINDIVTAVFSRLISKTNFPFSSIGDKLYLPFFKTANFDYFPPSVKRYFVISRQENDIYSINLSYYGEEINTHQIKLRLGISNESGTSRVKIIEVM